MQITFQKMTNTVSENDEHQLPKCSRGNSFSLKLGYYVQFTFKECCFNKIIIEVDLYMTNLPTLILTNTFSENGMYCLNLVDATVDATEDATEF